MVIFQFVFCMFTKGYIPVVREKMRFRSYHQSINPDPLNATFMNKKYRIAKIIHQRLKWRKHNQLCTVGLPWGPVGPVFLFILDVPASQTFSCDTKYTKNGQLIHVLKSGCLCMFTGILLHSDPKIYSVNYSSNLNPTGGETLNSAGSGTPNADDHVENNTRMVQMAIHGHI